MRRRAAGALALLAATFAPPAEAHKLVPQERGIFQVRPESTQLLYELLIPAGPAAAHWRLLYDLNHDGRLSEDENNALTRGLAEAVQSRFKLKLEGNDIPTGIIDAKMTTTEANDGLSGRISAIIWLKAREIPPGVRKVELELTPISDPQKPALIRIESDNATVDSVAGAQHIHYEDGTDGVKLRKGLHCTLILNVSAKPGH